MQFNLLNLNTLINQNNIIKNFVPSQMKTFLEHANFSSIRYFGMDNVPVFSDNKEIKPKLMKVS